MIEQLGLSFIIIIMVNSIQQNNFQNLNSRILADFFTDLQYTNQLPPSPRHIIPTIYVCTVYKHEIDSRTFN